MPSVLWRYWLGGRKGIWPVKNMGEWWRWALVSLDGVVPSRMVGVSASVIFPCTIKFRNSFLAPSHPGGPGKRVVKRLWCVGGNRLRYSHTCAEKGCYTLANWLSFHYTSIPKTRQVWLCFQKKTFGDMLLIFVFCLIELVICPEHLDGKTQKLQPQLYAKNCSIIAVFYCMLHCGVIHTS